MFSLHLVRIGGLATALAVSASCLSLAGCQNTPPPQPLGPGGSWKILRQDEFDDGKLDTDVWTPHRGLEPATYGNPYNPDVDAHAFDPSRVRVQNSHLELAWDPTPITAPPRDERPAIKYPYTAGVVHSGKGFSFTYGYVEAKIRVPEAEGLWPAFWMLPMPVDDWPPEIDIMELIPDDTPDGRYHPHFNYHWKGPDGEHAQAGWQWYGEEGKSYAGDWHTYGLLWEAGRLQAFLDGQPGPVFENPVVTDRAMFLVLSTGIRKDYQPPAGAMEVDYVRVWQRE